MEKRVKIGLCGSFAHIEKFGRMINGYEESQTVGVWSEDPELIAGMADRLGCPEVSSYDELLAIPDLAGVVISTPNDSKKELILKAAAAGKSVFVEKPLCFPNAEDAHEIARAIEENHVKFFMTDPMVGRGTMYVRDFMQSGKLGKVESVHARYGINSYLYHDTRYGGMEAMARRMQGGVMVDIGVHALHQLYFLLGKPQSVKAFVSCLTEEAKACGHDDFASILAKYDDGTIANVESGIFLPAFANRIEVIGTHGAIIDESFAHGKIPTVRWCTTDVSDEAKRDPVRFAEEFSRLQWHVVTEDELPEEPDDHIRYFVRMLAYDIPNEQVGVDPASHHGVGIKGAVEITEMLEEIYASAAANG